MQMFVIGNIERKKNICTKLTNKNIQGNESVSVPTITRISCYLTTLKNRGMQGNRIEKQTKQTNNKKTICTNLTKFNKQKDSSFSVSTITGNFCYLATPINQK
jgi:hypothetical protein